MDKLPPWWDIETAFYIEKRGIDPDKARTFTILRWMMHSGDLRPLAAAILEGHGLDEAVLNQLAAMILDDFGDAPYRIETKPRQARGRPKEAAKVARTAVAALAHESHLGKSKLAFEEIAKALGTSEQTVRQAVTAWRKANKANALSSDQAKPDDPLIVRKRRQRGWQGLPQRSNFVVRQNPFPRLRCRRLLHPVDRIVVDVAATSCPPQHRAKLLEHVRGLNRRSPGNDRVENPVYIAPMKIGEPNAADDGDHALGETAL